jgi:glycolate oxidase
LHEWEEQLRALLSDKRVFTELADRYSYSFDASFGEHLPEVVVQPKTTEEVQTIMKIANQFGLAVTPRGQGTCLSGGPLPVKGGILLDMAQWPREINVFADDLIAVVTPSVLTADIHAAAENHGLMYPPDPSSAHVSTIGGNLAENSGGPRGLKYGVTKDFVIGLEIVTPEGEVMHTGGRTIKNVTGYDLTKLLVGSEGTLGVITKATLKLVPKPPAVQTMMAAFTDMATAGKAISKTLTSGVLPAKMEFMDRACIEAVERYRPSGLPTASEALLLIELDGHPETIKLEAEQVKQILVELQAEPIITAESDEEAQKLWSARKLVSPAIATIKPTKISEDATVPRSRIPEMMERLKQIKEDYQVELVVFGHIGDGNLHPDIMCDQRDEEEMIRAEKAVAEIFRAALELGGTLSGEHGIGTMKAPFMEQEMGEVGVSMLKRIKEAWDPNNIMNPGKIFAEKGQKLVLRDG